MVIRSVNKIHNYDCSAVFLLVALRSTVQQISAVSLGNIINNVYFCTMKVHSGTDFSVARIVKLGKKEKRVLLRYHTI